MKNFSKNMKGRIVKTRNTGFTIVELLTVLTIIAILVGILVPSLTMVRNKARDVQQQTQLNTIGLGLDVFKNDTGGYPPSNFFEGYCGAQKLCEAMLGWDLMGFHPDSEFTSDGKSKDDTWQIYLSDDKDNLEERKEHYIDFDKANAFKLGNSKKGKGPGLFGNTLMLEADTFVLCDVFGVRRLLIGEKTVKAGTPILYYKANRSSKTLDAAFPNDCIYNSEDNEILVSLGRVTESGAPGTKDHLLYTLGSENFYTFIEDPKVSGFTNRAWPYRPDSYLLISAGRDGIYGTEDDICNFDR